MTNRAEETIADDRLTYIPYSITSRKVGELCHSLWYNVLNEEVEYNIMNMFLHL